MDVVGRAKNDKTYHIYAITNYNEKGAVGLLKNNPSRPVGNAIKDGSFDNSIRDNSENVNTSDEKTLKKSSRKSLDVEQSEKEKRESGYESETQGVKKETTEENSVDVGAQSSARYSIDEKNVIKQGMTEQERYKILSISQ